MVKITNHFYFPFYQRHRDLRTLIYARRCFFSLFLFFYFFIFLLVLPSCVQSSIFRSDANPKILGPPPLFVIHIDLITSDGIFPALFCLQRAKCAARAAAEKDGADWLSSRGRRRGLRDGASWKRLYRKSATAWQKKENLFFFFKSKFVYRPHFDRHEMPNIFSFF